MAEVRAPFWESGHVWEGWKLHPEESQALLSSQGEHARSIRPLRAPLPPNSEPVTPINRPAVDADASGPLPPPSDDHILVFTKCGPRPPPSHLQYEVPPRPKREDMKRWRARKKEREEVVARTQSGNSQLRAICGLLLVVPVLYHIFRPRVSEACKHPFNACACEVWPNDGLEIFCAFLLIGLSRAITFNISRNYGQKFPAGFTGVVPAALRDDAAGMGERVSAVWNSVNVLLVVLVCMAKLLTDNTQFGTPLNVVSHPEGGWLVLPGRPPGCSTQEEASSVDPLMRQLQNDAVAEVCGTMTNNGGTPMPNMPIASTSACDCQRKCGVNVACKGWTFSSGSFVTDGKNCWLRSKWGAPLNNCGNDCTSGQQVDTTSLTASTAGISDNTAQALVEGEGEHTTPAIAVIPESTLLETTSNALESTSTTTLTTMSPLEVIFAAATNGECTMFESPQEIRSAAQLYFGAAAVALFMLGAFAISIGEAVKLCYGDRFVAEDRIDISILRRQSSVLEQSPAFATMTKDASFIVEKIDYLQKLRIEITEESSHHLLKKEKSQTKATTVEIKVLLHELAEKAEGLFYISMKQMRQLANTAHIRKLAWSTILQAFGFILWLPSEYVLLSPCLGFDEDIRERMLVSLIPLPAGDTYLSVLRICGFIVVGVICLMLCVARLRPRMTDKVPILIFATLACYVVLFMDFSPPGPSKHPWRSVPWNVIRPANLMKAVTFVNAMELLLRLLFLKVDCCNPSWLEQHQYDLEVEARVLALFDAIGDRAANEHKIRKVVARCCTQISEAATAAGHLRVLVGYHGDIKRPDWPPEEDLLGSDYLESQELKHSAEEQQHELALKQLEHQQKLQQKQRQQQELQQQNHHHHHHKRAHGK